MKRMMFAVAAIAAISAAAAPMMTPWGEKVTSENCWRDYPRPQLARANWTCLNGDWDYAITAITNTPGRPVKWDGRIRVPFALEAPLSGCGGRLLEPDEYLWYTRMIDLDPKPGERILLHFGAVDFRAIVYLGHDEVALHEGGQLPFTADLTPFAKKGANTLTVLVWDPTEDFIQSRGKQAFKTHACFYTRSSGITQTVWLETVPETYIADYDVTTDIDKGEVTLTFECCQCGNVANANVANEQLELEIETGNTGNNGNIPSAPLRATFVPGIPCTIKLPVPVALWSPEEPNLYHFTARYGRDEIKGYFAMRRFEKRRDAKGVLRFYLNNKPYYVMGTLDQGWWPDGLLTPPSEEAMAFDIQTLKDCGFNTMRKHIKVEPLRYYALCDRMGLLVLQDMPCSNTDRMDPYKWQTVKGYALYREELKGMIDLLRKVPSIVMWVPYNEGWGQHDGNLTHTTLDFVKRYDATRLVNGPSGWQDWEGGELHRHKMPIAVTPHKPDGECEAADVVDYHRYRGPAMPSVNDRRVSFLGEFGGLGHPVEGHVWRAFDQGRAALGEQSDGDWGYGGIEDTKTREGLEKTYLGLMDKLGDFAEQGLAGSIYTQTTDVEIEINGLLTYDRKVLKYNPEVLKKAHAEVIRRAQCADRGETTVLVGGGQPGFAKGVLSAKVSVSSDGNGADGRCNSVPELMKTFDGKNVRTLADWENVRAPEILERYRRDVFGRRPAAAEERGRVSFAVSDVREAMDGRAIRKLGVVNFDGPKGRFSFPFTTYIPKSDGKVPAFVFACNHSRVRITSDGTIESEFWPVAEIVGRGFAAIAFEFNDVSPDDQKPDFNRAIFKAVQDASERTGESWSAISAWAWGASRIMDWIETEPLIDARHVGIVGHSRGGKTAIWTGANDSRFAMVCSNDSGCSGAKLNHMALPKSEGIAWITKTFPHWFCRNYNRYAGKEMKMDFDQHELLALIAPRLLCVASATEDAWAGPEGEWMSAKLASPAWELYGRKGLVADKWPAPETPQQEGSISYHLRTGRHFLSSYDWKCYMDFADKHGWKTEAPTR